MSNRLDMLSGSLYIAVMMAFEERRTWIEALVTVIVPGWYFASVLPQASTTPVAAIQYQWPLGVSVAVLIATIVGGIIATNIAALVAGEISAARDRGDAARSEATDAALRTLDRSDERDATIGRIGAQVGGTVLGIAVLVPLGLAMAEREQFWIANALYAALVLSSLASSAVKLVAYRRGL
jgi:hypothetical protein